MARVLIIDDDRNVCDAISNVVIHHGHETVNSQTLKDALSHLETEPFDVVVPEVSGGTEDDLQVHHTLVGIPEERESSTQLRARRSEPRDPLPARGVQGPAEEALGLPLHEPSVTLVRP